MKFTPRRGRQRVFKRPVAIVPKADHQECAATIDFKNVALLRKLITSDGKIIPRRITKMNASQHRAISRAVKNARIGALLPFVMIRPTRD
jgi:small subunit ribosomal protein S18